MTGFARPRSASNNALHPTVAGWYPARRRVSAIVDPKAGRPTCDRVHYRGNVSSMAFARSRVTAQGQVSVPAEVRRRLGVGPGSLLEWNEEGNAVVVRRSGRYTSADIHRALFGRENQPPRSLTELKEGIRKHVRTRHARG